MQEWVFIGRDTSAVGKPSYIMLKASPSQLF